MYMKVVNQITKHLARRKERELEVMKRSRDANEQQPALNDDQASADVRQAAPADTEERASEANKQQPAMNGDQAPAADRQASADDIKQHLLIMKKERV